MNELDHQRCSELLGPHTRVELSGDQARLVEAHLKKCEQCRAEFGAVGVLAVGDDELLTDIESARLRREVRTALDIGGRREVARRRKPLMQRLAPALGAAALIVVGAVVAVSLGGGQDDGGDGGGPPALKATDDSVGGAAALDSARRDFDAPAPVFVADVGNLGGDDLARLGRTGFRRAGDRRVSARNQAAVGAPSDLEESRKTAATSESGGADEYAGILSALAQSAPARDQIEECARQMPAEIEAAPVFAAFGRFNGRPALFLGFVRARPGSSDADRFSIWVWPRGSCGAPLYFLDGRLRP